MEYKENIDNGVFYVPIEVHSWKPPCSCGIELGEALEVESTSEVKEKVEARQPFSDGVSLDKIID